MKIILGAVLVVLIALLGSRTTFTRVRLPLAARHIYLTGTEYILVGFCLSSHMLGLLDQQALEGLDPLLYLALGWIGLMFGIQLEIPQIKRFPKQYFLVAVLQAAATMIFCFFPFLFLTAFMGGSSPHLTVLGALALGSIAIPTAQSSLALLQRELKLRKNKLMEILSYVAGIDALIALSVFGFLFCYGSSSYAVGSKVLVSVSYLVASLALGVVMGILLDLLTRVRCSKEELYLYTIGMVVFSAGAAAFLGISSLFVTVVCGCVIANTKSAKIRILRALIMFEKPFYIIVLLFGGAMLGPIKGWTVVLGLTGAYIAFRMLGKIVGGALSSIVFKTPVPLPKSFGLGLISQGGMAVAMVVSFHHAFGGEMADAILMLVLVAIIVNELISPFLTRIVIGKAS